MSNNIDEILKASDNYVNEEPNHSRKDGLKDFAWGTVNIRNGKTDYSADVIVGNNGTRLYLYDVINLKEIKIKEIELELESKDLAYQAFMSKINKARENKTLADTGTTKMLLKEALPAFCKGLKDFYTKADSGKPGKRHICAVVLKQLEIEHVAFLSLRSILSNAIPQVNLTSLAKELGTELELEMKFQDVLSTLSEKERSYFQVNLNKRIGMSFKTAFVNAKDKWLADEERKEKWEKWTDSVRCNLGMKLIDIFIVSTGLGKISRYSQGIKLSYRFEIAPEIVQYIAHNDKEMADLLFKNLPISTISISSAPFL